MGGNTEKLKSIKTLYGWKRETKIQQEGGGQPWQPGWELGSMKNTGSHKGIWTQAVDICMHLCKCTGLYWWNDDDNDDEGNNKHLLSNYVCQAPSATLHEQYLI